MAKSTDSSGGNNANISLSDVYNKCDLQYKGKQNEWIEINVLNVVFTMNPFK